MKAYPGGFSAMERYKPDYVEPREPHFHAGSTFEENPSTRYLAAEIEVSEGVQGETSGRALQRFIDLWGCGVGPDCCFEIQTAPASGDLWALEIRRLTGILLAGDARVDNGCGCHVHVDTRDLTVEHLVNVIRIWVQVEGTMEQLVPSARRRSTYCHPVADALAVWLTRLDSTPYPDLTTMIGELVFQCPGESATRYMKEHSKHGWMRSRTLNLRSHWYRGTIECRLLEGTLDASRIIHWGMLLANMVDYAKLTSPNQLRMEVEKVDGLELLFRLCHTPAHRRWLIDAFKEHTKESENVQYTTQAEVPQAAVR